MLGFAAGERVDITSVCGPTASTRRVDGFLLVEYDIPRGCLGAYYPRRTNPLVPLVVGGGRRRDADLEVDSGAALAFGGGDRRA